MNSIYTIGHSTHSITAFLDMLGKFQIETLIDIRSVPFSQYSPQFNQSLLQNSLAASGITYVFLGNELGGRIQDASCYKNSQIPHTKTGYALYLAYDTIITKNWFTAGIEKVQTIANEGRSAIMCSEENPEHCHRELIVGRRLKELGHGVIHIRSNRNKNKQLELF